MQENRTPSEGGERLDGRETPLQTLWRAWRVNSPSEGGTISQEYCTPSEGGKGLEWEWGMKDTVQPEMRRSGFVIHSF